MEIVVKVDSRCTRVQPRRSPLRMPQRRQMSCGTADCRNCRLRATKAIYRVPHQGVLQQTRRKPTTTSRLARFSQAQRRLLGLGVKLLACYLLLVKTAGPPRLHTALPTGLSVNLEAPLLSTLQKIHEDLHSMNGRGSDTANLQPVRSWTSSRVVSGEISVRVIPSVAWQVKTPYKEIRSAKPQRKLVHEN